MLTEFNGERGRGRDASGADLEGVRREGPGGRGPSSSTLRPTSAGSNQWVVRREGEWQLDNGYCRGARLVAYFSGEGPDSEADCKPNEVSVPLVVGMTEAGAEAELASQPLEAKVVYRPAKAGALPGLVVDQDPRRGGLSAHDEVTVVVAKAQHGLLPNFVGSSLADAQREAKRLKIRLVAHTSRGREGPCCGRCPSRESPSRRGCASGSWSGTAHEARAGERVAPQQVGRARDADARGRHDLDACGRRIERERRLAEIEAVVRGGDAERLREPARARTRADVRRLRRGGHA